MDEPRPGGILSEPPLDFERLLKEKRQQHFRGTREWLFNQLFEWLDDPQGARLSWLKGSGGTGKSVVAAVFLERLGRDDRCANYVAAYHFCRHDDAERSDPLRVASSLAAMLREHHPGFRDSLDASAISDALNDATSRPDKVFEAFLSDPLAKLYNNDSSSSSNTTNVVILIDALDELPRSGRAALLRMLKDGLGKLPADRVRVFVTSRPDEPDICATFDPFKPLELRVDEERNLQDVRACVEHIVPLYVRQLVTSEDLEKDVARRFGVHIEGKLAELKPLMDKSLRIYEEAAARYSGDNDRDGSFAAVANVEAFQPSQKPLQESDDFEVNLRKAREAQAMLEKLLGGDNEWAHKDGDPDVVKHPVQPEAWVDDAISPGVKSEESARRKLEDSYDGHANKLTDLARVTVVAKSPRRLLEMLDKLKEFSEIVLLKNRFAQPTPIGYCDLKTLIKLPLSSGDSFFCEVQLNLESVLKAKDEAHEIYEDIRTALPDILRGAGLSPQMADQLEGFLIDRLNNSALDATIAAILDQAGGLMLYVRLAADHLEHLQAKRGGGSEATLTFADVLALPSGLDDMYEENLGRAFPGGAEDPSWIKVQPFVEVLMVAREPPHLELVVDVLKWSDQELMAARTATSLVFPVIDDRIHFLHKTIYDYLCSGRGKFSITAAQLASAEATLRDVCSRLLEPLIDRRMDSDSYSGCVKTQYALRHVVAHAAIAPAKATTGAVSLASFERVIRSLRFHEATAEAGLCVRLIHDLIALAAACDDKAVGGDDSFALLANRVREWVRFVRQYNREFMENPAFVYEAAANWPDATEPYRAFVEDTGIPVVSIEVVTGKPQRLDPCLLVLRGHEDYVWCCAFSPPSGKLIVTASDDDTARVWEVETGALLLTYDGHSRRVFGCAFSPDGERVVTAGWDETARVWVAATGETQLVLEGHTQGVESCTFSPDGALIATSSSDRTARLWDAETGRQVRMLEGHSEEVRWCAFSPNSELLATASHDRTVRVWTVAATAEPPRVIEGHSDLVRCCSFSPDGERLVTASRDKTARVWLVETGECLRVLKGHTNEVHSCAFSPAGERIVTASHDKSVRLWNGETGAPLGVFNGHTGYVVSCAFSPNGKLVASASWDETVRIWDADAPDVAPPESEVERSFECWRVAMSPDGKRIVTAEFGKSVARVWDAETGAMQLELRGRTGDVRSCAFSSSGELIVTASDDGKVRLWSAETGAELRVFQVRNRSISCCFFRRRSRVDMGACCCAFSPDDKLIASGSWDGTARLWDVKRSHELKRLVGHTAYVNSCAFSPNSQLVATCSDDKTARLWAVATGALRHRLEGHSGSVKTCAFSPSIELLATASFDKTVRLWRVETGALERVLSGHTRGVFGCAFSSDGEWVVTASWDKTARVWDVATGAQLAAYRADSGVWCVAASSKSPGRIVIGTEKHGFRTLLVHAPRSSRTHIRNEVGQAATSRPMRSVCLVS